MLVLVSTTSIALWRNPIPHELKTRIAHRLNASLKTIEELPRHHPILIEEFQIYYDRMLYRCIYATLRKLPDFLNGFYQIVQIPCFDSILHPEMIQISVDSCLYYTRTYDPEEYSTVLETLRLRTKTASPFIGGDMVSLWR